MSEAFDPYHRWLGIQPKDQPPHHYRLLGIDLFENDTEVIRDATERQMAHVRKYQLGPHSAISQKILNELATAKSCLINRDKKVAYDSAIKAKLSGSGDSKEQFDQPLPLRPPSPPPPPTRSPLLPITKERVSPIANSAGKVKTTNLIEEKGPQHRKTNWTPYIGLGTAVMLGVILVTIFAMRGNKQAPEIPNSNNQFAQVNDRAEKPPRNTDARSEMPSNDKSSDPTVGGSFSDTPPAGNQITPADNHGVRIDDRGSKIAPPVEIRQKSNIDEKSKKDEPQQQAEIPQPDHQAPSSTTSIPIPDQRREPAQDFPPVLGSKNPSPLQPPKNQLSSRTSTTPIQKGQKGQSKSKTKSDYLSSLANNKIILNLPSGKTFDTQLFNVDLKSAEDELKDKHEKLLKDHDYKGQVILLGSTDGVHTWGEQNQGKLNGVLLAFYNDRIPKIYANYTNDNCNGVLIKWNENGDFVYGCQYKRGSRQGMGCYFKDNILRILFEMNNNKFTAVHLCNNSELIKSFDSIDKAAIDGDAKMFIGEVNTVESELKSNESEYKKQIKKEFNMIIGRWNKNNRDEFQNKLNIRGLEQKKYLDGIRQSSMPK